MNTPQPFDDDHVDDAVDTEISNYLKLDSPQSFFLFAGAGSGKTRSLVIALNFIRKEKGDELQLHGKQVAVITYTNAACDEIKQRLDFDSLFVVSTIHSFVWKLIKGYNHDIRQWLKNSLTEEISNLEEKQSKVKNKATKTALGRANKIEGKKKRLDSLDRIKRFTYNPNGDNTGRDSLNHSEVIKIGANFLTQKKLMQRVLMGKFPILLIDESQDANKLLMEAFLEVQKNHKDEFALGLFCDTMQRIYADGKIDLGNNLPEDWKKPAKIMNHRSPKRIVKLINRIRSAVDGQKQQPRTDKEEGFVRLFVFPGNTPDKSKVEQEVVAKMAEITGDPLWNGENSDIKALILEHHMAARRMGFWKMFEPLYKIDRFKTGLLDGTLSGVSFFSKLALPLVRAKQNGDKFKTASIVKKNSRLLDKSAFTAHDNKQIIQLRKANKAVEQLSSLFDEDNSPKFIDILQNISKTGLFKIPECLRPLAIRTEESQKTLEAGEDTEPELAAWDDFLQSDFNQIEGYDSYVAGHARFDTHQGVKGL